MVTWLTSPTTIPSLQSLRTDKLTRRKVMKEYIIPVTEVTVLKVGNFCASFDSTDNTETWTIEEGEDL